MKRRKAREYILKFLYAWEINDYCKKNSFYNIIHDELEKFWDSCGEEDRDIKSFTNEIIEGTLENLENIDILIKKYAKKWDVERILTIDKNILRFAIYEILYRPDIPFQVSINEALEIAKKYSTKESVAFINGILDKIAKQETKLRTAETNGLEN